MSQNRWNTINGTRSRESRQTFSWFWKLKCYFWLASLCKIISRRPDLTPGHTGAEALWDFFYPSTEQITSCETAGSLQPKPLAMHVHPHSKDYQSVAVIGCCDFICHLLQAVLTVTEVTLFSCLLSTRFAATRLWCVLQNDMFVFVSRHSSALLGRPKVFYLWTLWHWEVRDYFKPRNILVSTFQRNSAPPAPPELHLLPGNNSLLNILSGSIEINWERVRGSEA